MKVRCLIRDSVTTVTVLDVRLDFVPNEHGHAVCDVASDDVLRYLLGFMSGQAYVAYKEPVKPEIETEESVAGMLGEQDKEPEPTPSNVDGSKQEMIDKYSAISGPNGKDEIEKECLEDFGVDLNKTYSLKNLKKQVFELIDKKYGA
jgi:hypothetical protein